MKAGEAVDYLRAVAPEIAVPIHQAGLAAIHQQVHYGLFRNLAPTGTTVHVLDPGARTELLAGRPPSAWADRADIARAVGDCPAGVPRRLALAGPVVAGQSQPSCRRIDGGAAVLCPAGRYDPRRHAPRAGSPPGLCSAWPGRCQVGVAVAVTPT
jgi:hypothetical protein